LTSRAFFASVAGMKLLEVAVMGFCAAALASAQPVPAVPDFHLPDVDDDSPRAGQTVSPRDYLLQVSAYYFSDASCSYCRSQIGHLENIEADLRRTNPDLNIEIIGINKHDKASYNRVLTLFYTLPWLQDTAMGPTWAAWKAVWRDVQVVDAQNRLVGVFNLTSHDLGQEANRNTLKQMLLQAAVAKDIDKNGIADDWQEVMLREPLASPTQDFDKDGRPEFEEYAFGTDPRDPLSLSSAQFAFQGNGVLRVLKFSYRQRAGNAVQYTAQLSNDLAAWRDLYFEPKVIRTIKPLYDGTGTTLVTWEIPAPKEAGAKSFVRVVASPATR